MSTLRKIYRIIFPLNQNNHSYFNKRISWLPGFKKVSIENGVYNVHFNDGYNICLRDYHHSDLLVYDQVFIEKQYKIIIDILRQFPSNSYKIIDAGSNVGYTSLYFLLNLTDCQIIAIEPNPDNTSIFRMNIETNSFGGKVQLFQRALAADDNKRFNNSTNFRDKLDWANQTIENKDGNIASITISKILELEEWDCIDFLKIDIEGYEKEVFSNTDELQYLKKVRIIAIEVHEEFMSISQMEVILRSYNFLVFHTGELTIGVNKTFISKLDL